MSEKLDWINKDIWDDVSSNMILYSEKRGETITLVTLNMSRESIL